MKNMEKSTTLLEANYAFFAVDSDILAKKLHENRVKNGYKWAFELTQYLLKNKSPEIMDEIHEAVAAVPDNEKRKMVFHNKIPNGIRFEFAKLVAGIPTATTFSANYLALGNGTTEPANTDTKLENELRRGTFQMRSTLENTAYLDKFWGASEVGGLTILEAGTFCDWNAGPNSGMLLSRCAVNVVVGNNETLTCNVSITFNSAT